LCDLSDASPAGCDKRADFGARLGRRYGVAGLDRGSQHWCGFDNHETQFRVIAENHGKRKTNEQQQQFITISCLFRTLCLYMIWKTVLERRPNSRRESFRSPGILWRQRFAIMIAAVNAIISSSFLSSKIDACCCTRGGGTVWRAAKLLCSCIAAPSIIVGN
jgi:hypothetical protein